MANILLSDSGLHNRNRFGVADTFTALDNLQRAGWPGSRGIRLVSKKKRDQLMREGKWFPLSKDRKSKD